MATRADISSQMSSTQSQIDTTQAKLNLVEKHIAEVKAAKKEIENLKESADDLKIAFGKLDCMDTSYWDGSLFNRVKELYCLCYSDTKTYCKGLDYLADDLIYKETKLLNERDTLNGTLGLELRAWRWLADQYEALTN